MGQLMKVVQAIARGQEEMRQDNLRSATTNPAVNLVGSNDAQVITQPRPEGGLVNQNDAHTFYIPVHGGSHTDMDDHQYAFFILKADPIYDAQGPSPAEVDRKFGVLQEKLKATVGSGAFGLDVADMCLVPGVKIPSKFKIPDF